MGRINLKCVVCTGSYYKNTSFSKMAHQYSDLFTYQSFEVHGITISYVNATLLMDLCGKKTGSELAEIQLNITTGKFTVPRRHSKRTDEIAAANTLVEFKGVHTRFSDVEPPLEKGESSKTGVVTLKLYEHKRKLFKYDSSIKKYVISSVAKATDSTFIEEITGPRGELLVNVRPSSDIPMKVLTEFMVNTARHRSRMCYYTRVV